MTMAFLHHLTGRDLTNLQGKLVTGVLAETHIAKMLDLMSLTESAAYRPQVEHLTFAG